MRWQNHGNEDRKLLELCVMYFLVMIGVSIWAIVAQNSSKAQFSLVFSCLIVFLWFLIRRNYLVAMAKNLKAFFDRSINAEYKQKTDAVIMLCGVLAIISVLFIIDLNILSNSAVRIGAVAAFGLFTALKAVWHSFK